MIETKTFAYAVGIKLQHKQRHEQTELHRVSTIAYNTGDAIMQAFYALSEQLGASIFSLYDPEVVSIGPDFEAIANQLKEEIGRKSKGVR